MILQGLPAHEQHVLAGPFDTALQFVGDITARGGDDALGLPERPLELGLLAGSDVENRDFENLRH